MADQQEKSTTLPVPIILLVAAIIAGGVFGIYSPLKSMRSSLSEKNIEQQIGEQKVPARMWQDPFQAVENYIKGGCLKEGDIPNIGSDSTKGISTIFQVNDGTNTNTNTKNILLLPVMITVDHYQEEAEERLRTRYAILSALHVAGYRPKDGMHIGVFNANINKENRHVPYEWYCQDDLKIDKNPLGLKIDSKYGSVLVLWLGDEYFSNNRWEQMNTVIDRVKKLVKNNPSYQGDCNVIGPSDSRGLADIIKQNAALDDDLVLYQQKLEILEILGREGEVINELNLVEYMLKTSQREHPNENIDEIKKNLKNLELELREISKKANAEEKLNDINKNSISEKNKNKKLSKEFSLLSPWATADFALLWSIGDRGITTETENREKMHERLESHLKELNIQRTVHNDTEVTYELVEELARRGIKLKDTDTDHIVLISEWDTYYGRALPVSFAMSLQKYRDKHKQGSNQSTEMKSPNWPKCVYTVTYMRGIDGILPGKDSKALNSKDTDDSQKKKASLDFDYFNPKFEQPSGQDQFDYIRRVTEQIKQLKFKFNDIRAIGVMGSDIYDKLLILRALRNQFPSAIFFTTDLDARLWHHTELEWTRNLIVASSYGLQLHPDLQQDVPPFRSTYQTSLFISTLSALNDSVKVDVGKMRPRIFEIGRNGPYDLTPFDLPSEFSQDEFEEQKLKISELCTAIISDNKSRLFLNSQPDSIEWLNELLESPWVYNTLRLHKKEPPGGFSTKTQGLIGETERYREKSFLDLDYDEKNKIKMQNRRILEELYPDKTPKINLQKSTTIHPLRKDVWENSQWASYILPCILLFILPVAVMILLIYRSIPNPVNFNNTSLRKWKRFWCYYGCIWGVLFAVYFAFAEVSSLSGEGEPLTFFDGISIWTTDLIRFFYGFLSVHFFFISIQYITNNIKRSEEDISYIQSAKGIKVKTAREICDLLRKNQNNSKEWKIYFWVGIATVIYVFLGYLFIHKCGKPIVPIRGDICFYTDKVVLIFSLLCMSILTWFVIIDTLRYYLVIKKLSGKIAYEPLSRILNVRNNAINPDEYDEDVSIDWFIILKIIEKRTEISGRMIMYPFIILLLVIISRHNFIDNWTWTTPLAIVIGSTIFLILCTGVILFHAANTLRRKIVNILNDEHLKIIKEKIKADDKDNMKYEKISRLIEHIIKDIHNLKTGAFAPLAHNPILVAILTPFGGMGTIALIQQFVKF